MLVLGIESSCDETGVALYDTERGLLAHHLHTQMAMHAEYGGVVPELASRDHIRRVVPLTQGCLQEAGVSYDDIDAVAYTQGPGLGGALLAGSGYANALAFALNKPVIPIHHLEGHLLSPLLADDKPEFPFVALLVSGGHTQFMAVRGIGDYTLLGESVDDAAGEAFDKTAKLLGFKNYAELSLATKMADTPEQVLTFLHDLARRAKPYAEKDLAEVKAFARESLNLADPQPWDLSYASEKLREAKYAFSETEVKKYFPVSKVLAGLFAQIKKLYGIGFAEKTVPVWHKDVRYFELEQNGKTIGGVYMDLYAREGKRGGAWMNDYKGRRRFADGTLQLPTAYLVCNFTPPVGGKEARLSHDEILTLFHETGHGLHHLLTQVDELGVSGINGVEWDAVELPSQFMETFVWEYDVLAQMSAHEETGEPLPKELFDKMLAAKNFQRGMFLVRQMEFALFDMTIYSEENEGRLKNWQQVLDSVRKEVAVIQPPEYNRFANSFGHIFAGGYSAGYYSYAWAEVLSADAYAAFEESDDVAATGKRFWQEILAVGGSRSAAESFKAFRGREPSIDALLRHSGFDNAA